VEMEGVEDEDDVEAGDLEGSPAEEAGSMYTLMDQDMVRDWWDEIWQRRSKDNTFLSEFDPMPYNYDTTTFIDPDNIMAPRLPHDSVSERGPSPKMFYLRRHSGGTDVDFDYGSAIGKSPEECAAYMQDTESLYEVMAVSIENHLCRTGDQQYSDHENTASSSVQESMERNREYYENLRKCYDPDPVIISQVIPERSKSEESTPDMKKTVKSLHSVLLMDSQGRRKLLRRMTTPSFWQSDSNRKLDSAGRRKNTGNRPLKHSKTYLKRSTSSFDLQFNFVGQLGPVKESDDEGLTIPFEPEDSSDNGESGGYHLQKLKHMRGLVSKGILVDSFIKGVKRDIVFKEEAKDELHELPSVIDIAKKSNRLTSPEPLDLPSDLKRMSYKELNKFGMSAFSTPSPTEIGQLSPGEDVISPLKENPALMSISPILKATDKSKKVDEITIKTKRTTARLQRPSQGYLTCLHDNFFHQTRFALVNNCVLRLRRICELETVRD